MTGEGIIELQTGAADAGRRLDQFLAERLEMSRAQARRLLAAGRVRRGGRPVGLRDKGDPLAAGETIAVHGFHSPRAQRARPQPELPLLVLASGPGWLAVDKPAGMPVHPLREDETGTVLNAALARHPELHGVGEGGLRSGVVHRLDVGTSGVLLLASEQAAWERLRGLFAGHRLEKVYRAIVLGDLRRAGSVELPLRVARARPARVEAAPAASAPGARLCGLSWRPLAALRGATLVEARPVTGFLHQVRVTFAHLGHPLAGDRLYGPPSDHTGAARHLLHAALLSWEGGEAASADPPDFAAALAALACGG